MIILALDTAGTGCYAAVYDSDAGTVLACAGADIGKGHAELLMGFVEQALSESGTSLQDVDRLAVAVGPGSFTGIRVGVAAARGFALALDIPAIGISAFATAADASVRASGTDDILVAIDAKRDELYCQTFNAAGSALSEPAIYAIGEARDAFSAYPGTLCGSGAHFLSGDTPLPQALSQNPDVAVIARLAASADPDHAKPRPLYLRAPDAKPQTGFAIARA